MTATRVPSPQVITRSDHHRLCSDIARVARRELARWRPGGGGPITELTRAASPILREYYRVGLGREVTDAQMRSAAFQRDHPWSAVFISFVMRTAGAGPRFAYSAAHQHYIRAARANRLRGAHGAFRAYRATEVAPRVGDLVCAARDQSGATYDTIGGRTSLATHCDIVTEVRSGSVEVVGGNVGQTVGSRRLATTSDGRLDLTGRQARIFAIVRCPGRSAPTAPTTRQGAPASSQARVATVMLLLTRRYGYPAAGAAGLVGNLIAESGVLPNRIEGSSESDPLRARDFTGRWREFTPDEVRDRDPRTGTGPRLPGVGLAQWTSAPRRRGLFAHRYRGRQLSSAILFDLAAQVDYLVTELRTYPGVDRALRDPAVTVETASDRVLLDFERPASVLHRPLTADGLRVRTERRALGARALRIHTSAGSAKP